MNKKIWLSSPHMGGGEKKFVEEAFETNWIAPLGPNVNGFEGDIRKFFNQQIEVSALSSGTAAIHLGLIILGVEAGDEVICQSMTFSASANPIKYIGATPVFVDSETETWNMDPELLKHAIKDRMAKGKKPKAIVVVHLYGMPANMPEILKVAKEFEIPVLEDAAEALGSHINGEKCGTFGDIGVLSFNGNKIITTSGGGALLSKNKAYVTTSTFLSTQARDDAPHYQHSHIGFNYRMSNICAGIGRGQMEVLNKRINQRRENYSYYKKKLEKFSTIKFIEEPEGYFSNRWLTTILFKPKDINFRESVRLKLEKKNVESRPLWKPMHLQPIFHQFPFYGNGIAEGLFNSGLCLPSGSNLTIEEKELVIELISEMF